MNSLVKKNKSLKCGFAIKLLSIIALVCTVLSSVSYFFYYDSEKINGEWVYELTFRFPYFRNLILLLLSIAPFVLFVLYIFKYHNKLKATVIVPIIFGVFGLNTIFNFLFGFGYYGYFLSSAIYCIVDLVILICLILAVISALKGFNKRIFIIISMSVCLLYELLSLMEFFPMIRYYIENSRYLYLFTSPIRIIGTISLYIALLLFATKNRIPAIISISTKKKSAESMNPEQALRVLKDKFDFGMITEEEYQAQRAEIISKL